MPEAPLRPPWEGGGGTGGDGIELPMGLGDCFDEWHGGGGGGAEFVPGGEG